MRVRRDPEVSEEVQERRARCIALEKAYVHDVYDTLAPRLVRPRLWPRVHQFLQDLELGSLVADVGCGSGQYLEAGGAGAVGCERSPSLAAAASSRGHEVVLCDALALPYRDESLDAALSVAVIHHLASTERRVHALRELSRVLRVGGRVLITVWALEQTHRKFESQDVLVPYRQPTKSSSEDRGSSVEREMTSTTTSEDDLLMYQSYNPPASDSDTAAPARSRRKRQGRGQRGHSLDDSSSDLSSPSETCYSFMRRALQKLSSTSHRSRPYFYSSCRGAWFAESAAQSRVTSPQQLQVAEKEPQTQDTTGGDCELEDDDEDDGLIELRHLDAELPVTEEAVLSRPPSILEDEKNSRGHGKSRSLGDVLSIIPSILRSRRKKEGSHEFQKRISTASDPREYLRRIVGDKNGIVRSKSTASCFARFEHLHEDYQLPPMVESMEFPEEEQVTGGDPKLAGDISNATSQLTTSDIANGNSILNEEHFSSIVKGRLGSLDAPPSGFNGCRTKEWFNTFNNNANLQKCLISTTTSATVRNYLSSKMAKAGASEVLKKRMRFYGQRLQEKALLKNFYNQCSVGEFETEVKTAASASLCQEPPLSTYYSMPELHTLCEEPPQPPEASVPDAEAEEPKPAPVIQCSSQERKKDSFDSDIFVEEEEVYCVVQHRRRVVKRSMSVGTNNRKSESIYQQRRFSASSASASMCASPTTPRSRNVSEDSEESIVSVIPRKCSSLQSDTSVDSEESIVSVIQRSSSEIEAILQRREFHRACSNSLRASPLSICLGAQETSSPEFSPTLRTTPKNSPPLLGAFPRQYLEKFSDCEAVVLRDIIGAIVSFAHCTDALDVPQWANLQDTLQQEEATEAAERLGATETIEDEDNDSGSEDTQSYMSNPDLSAAGADASCCEDDIPQIELDVRELDDPYYSAAESAPNEESTTSSGEILRVQTDNTCVSTESLSSPQATESIESSSGSTLEPQTDAATSENELDALSVASPDDTPEELTPQSHNSIGSKNNDPALGFLDALSEEGKIPRDSAKSENLVSLKPNDSDGHPWPLVNFTPECHTDVKVENSNQTSSMPNKGDSEEESEDCSTGLCMTPIRLTIVKKSLPVHSGLSKLCSQNTDLASGEIYWERFLPAVLSVDATEQLTASATAMEIEGSPGSGASEVSSDDSLNVTVALSKTAAEDSSPDDSLESIAECSEEEAQAEQDTEKASDGYIPPTASQTKAQAKNALDEEKEISKDREGQNESTAEETEDDAEASEKQDQDSESSDCAPFPFNVIVEDYSEESDSCNEPVLEENAPQTGDCLTVEGLANSTSNGSSSTASFQTVLQCPSPTPVAEDDDGEKPSEVTKDDKDHKTIAQHQDSKTVRDDPDDKLSRKASASLSSSQESLQDTDGGGSSLMLHRYYHVFREGELDNLIDKYVENLHIISSYYDHASWCVIAEKVQVWTI